MPQLPPVPPGFPVDLPNLPPSADPPVTADWTAIRVHQAAVVAARTTFGETNAVEEALAECELYKVRLGIASSTPMITAVVQPAAQQPAAQEFTPIQLAQINGLLAPLAEQIGQLGEAIAQVKTLCHRSIRDNNNRANGHPNRYEPLPLVNGEWPEDANLPDLQNAQSFRDLPQDSLNTYITRYGGLAAMNAQRHVKLNALARYIGCTVIFGPALHPDGCLLVLGTLSSTIQIYDIRSQSFVASLRSEEVATPFAVNTLSFSENGYHLAAPDGTSSVAIWDLRKQKAVTSINLTPTDTNVTYKINRIRYDPSAQWFGVAGNHDARIIAHKTWEELVRFEEGGEVVDLAFGGLGKEVWGVSGREVRIWGSA
ncbi:hypothetical protein FRC00_004519 [Tulasnella sp. 408]|nr:hypothetical protein FRC00_004519 [Tulasnella sp. 408]